jgi:hypothetical protein
MFQAFRRHLTPSTLIALIALAFAMTGGAFAFTGHGGSSPSKATASNVSTAGAAKSKTKSKTKAGARGPAGLKGATGAQGAAGPVGAVGPVGPAGKEGLAGSSGVKGETGAAGTSVTITALAAKNANCKEGGSELKVGGTTSYACNGEKGKEGTFGGQSLPSGKTLRGAYAGDAFSPSKVGEAESAKATSAVSFALPIESASLNVHYIKAGETTPPQGCTGSAEDEPGAEAGNLCLFSENEEDVLTVGVSQKGGGDLVTGFEVDGVPAAKGNVYISGTWAAKAE